MKIVRFNGGLGNQMFQYALYLLLKYNDIDVSMDLSDYEYRKIHNGFELPDVFKNIDIKKCDNKIVRRVSDNNHYIFSKLKKKLIGYKKTHYVEKQRFDIDYKMIFDEKFIYLDGYWQSEKYFIPIKDKIFESFTFKEDIQLDSLNKDVYNTIKDSNSVSVHIRRGDYVKNKLHGGLYETIYYDKAISYILNNVNNPIFIFFSDDVKWVKENFDIKNAIYVSWNTDKNSYKDMHLMSLCKHNIIANSSFSWWGAYLNKNNDKIVIAPNKWFFDDKYPDDNIVPDSWIKL